MRAFEWTEEDVTWLKTLEIPLDISADYEITVEVLNFLIKQKSPYRVKHMLPDIEDFETVLQERTQFEFKDPTDPDAAKFINDSKRMLENIQHLKSQLVKI